MYCLALCPSNFLVRLGRIVGYDSGEPILNRQRFAALTTVLDIEVKLIRSQA